MGYISVLITIKHHQTPSTIKGRCRGKFVSPGKFFPPEYCHNVTNANPNPNPNLNPSPNPYTNLNPTPNPNPNSKFNPILNLNCLILILT